jgi:excisionase family DNA binding protein
MGKSVVLPDILTVAEVASYLRVSETTVWRWCTSGRLPGFRIGRGWRIRKNDLNQYIHRSLLNSEERLEMHPTDVEATG